MNSEHLFAMAIGISTPWKITEVKFQGTEDSASKELHISIDFERGAKFLDSTGNLCCVHDTKQKTWRHLNFFQHSCYLHCRVPRVTSTLGKVELVEVPWSRQGSGFTLMFEAYIMALIESEMPLNKVGNLVNENPHRIWTIFNYWIEKAYFADDPSSVKVLGVDETSTKKGHNYITLAVDIDERRVINIAEGKGKDTIKEIRKYLKSKNTNTKQITNISMDMSPSFIAGAKQYFPDSDIHFDRFHVMKLLNEAMNEVRKGERKEHAELKGHKYTFLKNADKLSDNKKKELVDLITLFPNLGKAYRLKELFNDLWEMDSEEEAVAFLVEWCNEVEESDIEPFKKFCKTVKSHWTGIVNFCETNINNGILEGINSKVQLAKRRARGYRQTKNFMNMIYFLCGKLKFDYPLVCT